MMVLVRVVVLIASVGCVFAAGAVPKCDKAITSKMAEYHPKGIPTNIIQSIQKNGRYSYTVVSSSEAKYMGLNVKCLGISMTGPNTAKVSYKLSRIPTVEMSFPVEEKGGILLQQDSKQYKLYVIYFSDAGVIFTYRCCDTCTGTAPDVGIAVADKLKDNKDTINAFDAAMAKMEELRLDKDISDLHYCS